MNLPPILPSLGALRMASENSGVALRLLAGATPQLQVGDQVTATVVQSSGGQTLLNLQGATVQAQGLPNLPLGTEVAIKVAAMIPQPVLQLAVPVSQLLPRGTLQAKSAPPSLNQSSSPLGTTSTKATAPANEFPTVPLAVGQEFTAQVVEQLPGNRLILNVQGEPVEAEAPHPFPPGAQIPLRVAQVQPQVVLHIQESQSGLGAAAEAHAAQIVRANIAGQTPAGASLHQLQQTIALHAELFPDQPLPESLTKLQTLLHTLAPEDAPPTAEQTVAYVRDGGLQFEAKLADAAPKGAPAMAEVAQHDVKGLLLQSLQDLGATGKPTTAMPLATPVVNHLIHIEAQQALNLLAKLHGEPIQLQLPIAGVNGAQASTAYLSVEADPRSGQDASGKPLGYDVLFHLDLANLGPTKIDAHFTGQTARVVFYADNPKTVATIRAELPTFQLALQGVGFRDVLLGAQPTTRLAPDKQQKFSALTAGVPSSVRLVDVRA